MIYENEALNEREKTHGDYGINSAVSQGIKSVMMEIGCSDLSPEQAESLDLIATKIGRICSGDPNTKDHWDDIAGYANLVSARLKD
jgi:hypothetical protein